MRIAFAGACLLLGAVLWLVLLVVSGLGGYDWPKSTQVPPDGQPHAIEVTADRDAMLWRYQADAAYPCEIVDGATETVLSQEVTRGWNRRVGGSAGHWVGTHTVRPTSDTMIITCQRRSGMSGSFLAVESTPRLPWFLIRGTESSDGPFAMFALGAMLMGAAGLRRLWRARRSYLRRW